MKLVFQWNKYKENGKREKIKNDKYNRKQMYNSIDQQSKQKANIIDKPLMRLIREKKDASRQYQG